jgi:hypothetical protein
VAGQDGRDVAELPAVAHDGIAEAGPAARDVGDDPLGDSGAGLLIGRTGHAVHNGSRGKAAYPGLLATRRGTWGYAAVPQSRAGKGSIGAQKPADDRGSC